MVTECSVHIVVDHNKGLTLNYRVIHASWGPSIYVCVCVCVCLFEIVYICFRINW